MANQAPYLHIKLKVKYSRKVVGFKTNTFQALSQNDVHSAHSYYKFSLKNMAVNQVI